ncbi:MAG TPA: type II toxin-antitoxin system VapC family toxin [Chthoniobacterales bacterium]|jgi:predicted nucleic acid-binding protein|nr:type II toxin-antitoxin system VapC family toxin [Chthoniobacterales bacterium]
MELSFDTTFLIDLHRDIASEKTGAATRFLSKDPDAVPVLSVIALGEFAAGFEDPAAPWLVEVRRRFTILPVDEEVSFVYREVFRALKRKGRLIGANDLWIGSTAIAAGVPLVTRNGREFRRISGLNVITY